MTLPVRTRAYIVLIGLLALAAMAFYLRDFRFLSLYSILAFVLFLFLGFLSEIYAVWIPTYGSEVSSSMAIYMASLFILGPSLTVAMVLVTTLASEVLMRWEHLKANPRRCACILSFNIGQVVLTVSVTGLLFFKSGSTSFALATSIDYIWAMLAFICYAAVNLALVTGVVSMTERQGFLYRFLSYARDFSVQYLVLGVLALLLADLYLHSVWHMLLALVPLFLVHLSFRSYQRLRTEARKTFERISRILDERDHYTAVHSASVAELSARIAKEMGMSQRDIERIDIAARVHDIGKVAIPDVILLKPGTFDEEEWEAMKRHPVISAELIEGLEIYAPVARAVRHEHERWDGSGYPDGLKGDEIPLFSRLIAAADIYDALLTDRPYRRAFSREKTIEMIRDMRGTELDPEVVDVLMRVITTLPQEAPSSQAAADPADA